MLCQWFDGEFVPEVVDEAVSYLLHWARLPNYIVIPAVTLFGFPQDRMPSILQHHALWVVHEGEDLFLVEVDVVDIRLTIWSTQSRPAITHWIWCVIEVMVLVDARIHSGWRQVLE